MKRPDYHRALQALDAVIRERGFEQSRTKTMYYAICRFTKNKTT